MQVHARNTACEGLFLPKSYPVFRRPAEAPLAETADSCRPRKFTPDFPLSPLTFIKNCVILNPHKEIYYAEETYDCFYVRF